MRDAGWIVPEWPAPGRVQALMTTRSGGVSLGPYASLNLGLKVNDGPQAVAANRARLREALPAEPRWLNQVHGNRVVEAEQVDEPVEADAAVSRTPGTVCAGQNTAASCSAPSAPLSVKAPVKK